MKYTFLPLRTTQPAAVRSLYQPKGKPLPASVDLRPRFGPVWDQGPLGSCTAFASLAWYAYWQVTQGKPWQEYSELAQYWEERNIDGDVNRDGGSYGQTAIEVLEKFGVMAKSDDPYNTNNFQNAPDASKFIAGSQLPASSVRQINPANALTETLDALANGMAVLFGFTVFDNLPVSLGTGILQMPAQNEQPDGGHEVVAVGYDKSKNALLIRNSWGPNWGSMGGYFWMPFDYFSRYADPGMVYVIDSPPAMSAELIPGFDVSENNGEINWLQIPAHFKFVYVKSSEGKDYADSRFDANVQGAKASGKKVGIYHLVHPDQESAEEEANFFAGFLKKYQTELMPVLDLEEPAIPGKLTAQQIASWALAFVNQVKQATGRDVRVYTGPWYAEQYGGLGELASLSLWVSHYGVSQPNCMGWNGWDIWQYSSSGSVPGINGYVDLDVYDPQKFQELMEMEELQKQFAALQAVIDGYQDQTVSDWAHTAFEKAKAKGIIKGDGNNVFDPKMPVTREQLMTFFDRLGLLG